MLQKLLIMEPARFIAAIQTYKVSILEVVPSYLSVLMDELENNPSAKAQLADLSYLMVTGEAVPGSLVSRWFSVYPEIKMVNAYGPTEASDDITHYIMDKAPSTESVPIGRVLHKLKI